MKLFRTIDGNAHQPTLVMEKLGPPVVNHRPVGLYDVVYLPALRVLTLQPDYLFIKRQGAHERFSAMPAEKNLLHGLALNVLLDKAFKHFIAHDVTCIVAIQLQLL